MAVDLGGVYSGFYWQVKGISDVLKNIKDVGARADQAGEEAESAFDGVGRSAGSLGDTLLNVVKGFAGFGLAVNGVKALGNVFGFLTNSVTANNAEFERYQTQLSVLLGGMDEATERITELSEFGQKTPFELPGIIQAEKVLTSFGLTAEDAADKFGHSASEIRTIAGDVAAGTGQRFEDIAGYIGRFSAGATGEAIARFQELGVVTRKELSEMGIEFKKSGEMITPVTEATEILISVMGDKFGGMMDAQSATFEGMTSNLQDWLWEAQRVAAEPIFDALKEQLAGLLDYLNQPQIMEGITRIAKGMAVALTQVIETVRQIIEWFQAIDPEAIKVAAAFTAIGVAIPQVVTAITSVKTAFIALNAAMMANPIGLIAVGIVAAGLGIAAIVDKVQQKADELAAEQDDMSRSIAEGAQSYDEYREKMVAYLRESRDLPASYSDQQIAINAVNDGIMVSQQNWSSYAQVMSQEAGPALTDLKDGLLSTRVELEQQAAILESTTVRTTQSMGEMRALWGDQAAAQQVAMNQALEGYDPAPHFERLIALQETHHQAMQTLELQNIDTLGEMEFTYLDEKAQMEAEFQAEHEMLVAEGNLKDAEALTEKFTEESAKHDAAYSDQLAMQKLSNLKKQLEQKRAYLNELLAQQAQVKRELQLSIQKAMASGKISAEEQTNLLKILGIGNQGRLENEGEYASKALEISNELASGQVENAATTMEALLAIQEGEIAAGRDAMNQLNLDIDGMINDIINSTNVSTGSMASSLGGSLSNLGATAGTAAGDAAGTAATRTLSSVASDINAAIAAIREAIQAAPSVIWDNTTEAAFNQVGEAIKSAVTLFYSWMDEEDEDGTQIKEKIESLASVFDPLLKMLQVMQNDFSKLEDQNAEDIVEVVKQYIWQLKVFSGSVHMWLEDIDDDTREAIEEAGPVADNLKKLFAMIGVDLQKIVPSTLGDAGFGSLVTRYLRQLQILSGNIYKWMTAIDVSLHPSLDLAARLVPTVKKLFDFLGVDLTKLVPRTGDFGVLAARYIGQLAHLSGGIYKWMIAIRGDTKKAVIEAADTAKYVKNLFDLIGVDLTDIVPVEFRFGEKVHEYLGQLAHLSGRIYEWMSAIDEDTRPLVGEAAQVAQNVKDLFEVLDVDLTKIVPMGIGWEAALDLYFAQLDLIGRKIMWWLGFRDEETRAQVAEAAELAGSVTELFSVLDLDFSDKSPLSGSAYASVLGWLDGLMDLTEEVFPRLLAINDRWGESIEIVSSIAERIGQLFNGIATAAQSIFDAGQSGGLHLGTARGLMNQMMGIIIYARDLANTNFAAAAVGGAGYVGGGQTVPVGGGDVPAAGGGVVIQEQRIVLFENSPVTVSNGEGFVETVTERMNQIAAQMGALGRMAAIRGAVRP